MARAASVHTLGQPCPIEREVVALAERQNGHETRDDDRFGNLLAGQARIEANVRQQGDKLDSLVSDVSEIKGTVASLSAAPPPPPPVDPGHWHIGPGAWAALVFLAGAAAGLVAWLAAQIYDLQPERIKAAQSPVSVQIAKP